MKSLYPERQPYQTFFLETGSQHSVYVEVSGNPDGIPVIFLHGGPCSGTRPDHRRFFHPEKYKTILFDQRGCGKSLPFGEIEQNSTQDLIDDMERIRNFLKVNKWLVFGGSWGGALGLLYAQQYTDNVLGMVIRGMFLARQQDMDWFAGYGANQIYPETWLKFIDSAPEEFRDDIIAGLWCGISSVNQAVAYRIAKAWQSWNGQVALGKAFGQFEEVQENNAADTIKQVKMELHYAKHSYFIEENQILAECGNLSGIPATIIHGRYDLVCPLASGLSLHQALPGSDFIVLPNAGHIAQHEEMIDALVTATDDFAARLTF